MPRTRAASLIVLFIAGFGLAAPPQLLEQFTGEVIAITDGDTVKVLVGKQQVTVRLEGIDAPEAKQDFGNKAKDALGKLVFGKILTVKSTGLDQYGRTLGFIFLGNEDVNSRMLKDGWAWHFKKYNNETRLAKLEEEARSAKRGLWADSNAQAPWDFRASQKTRRNALAEAPLSGGKYWLNTSSNVRHNQSCKNFESTKRGRLCGPDEGKACGICGG